MTPREDRAKWQALCDGATPGEWQEVPMISIGSPHQWLHDKDKAFCCAAREAMPRLLADLDEAEALATAALSTADGHREYGERMEAERDAQRATCDQLRAALERTQAELAAEVSDADIMRARDALARAREVL